MIAQIDKKGLDLHHYLPLFLDGICDTDDLCSALATQERHPYLHVYDMTNVICI